MNTAYEGLARIGNHSPQLATVGHSLGKIDQVYETKNINALTHIMYVKGIWHTHPSRMCCNSIASINIEMKLNIRKKKMLLLCAAEHFN